MVADQRPGAGNRGTPVNRTTGRGLVLELPKLLRVKIVDHLRGMLPNEGVCLIATTRIDGAGNDVRRGKHMYPGTNIDASPVRFTMDPREVANALREIADQGWDLGAIAHSHPRGPATLSPTDLRELYYPDTYSLIVSFAGTPPDLKAWSVHEKRGSARIGQVAVELVDAIEASPRNNDGVRERL